MISEINIKNFKAIEDVTIKLSRFNILIGANNSGKSSILQAIQFAVGAAQTARKNAKNLETDIIKYSANASSFTYLPIRDIEALVYNRTLTQTKGCSIKMTEDKNFSEVTFKRGKNRNIATSINSSELSRKIMSQQPYCVYTPGISGISISEEYKSKAVVLKSATRGDSNFYLRNILLLLNKEGEQWNNFNEKFSLFFPDYKLNINFDEDSDENIDVFVELAKGTKLPIDALGTSALQILQILSYIFYFNPQMLILDEPDTHLHPNNQRRLISTLNNISQEYDMQVLIATHSRHITDEASSFAQFLWMRNGKLFNSFTESVSPEYLQMMMDLGAFDKNELFNNKNIKWVICTEDARSEKEQMLKSILLSSGFNSNEFVILPYNGCSKIESTILLNLFIKSFSPEIQMIVHRDRDYLSDDEISKIETNFKEKNIFIWFPEGTDIESVFANPQHIHKLYPDIEEEKISDIISRAIDEAKETSIEKFVNYKSSTSKSRDVRGINNDCERLFEENPNRYFYGKKVIGLIRSNLQSILHTNNPQIYSSTPYIKQNLLCEIASEKNK